MSHCDVTKGTDTSSTSQVSLRLLRPRCFSSFLKMWKVRQSVSFSRKLNPTFLREAVNRGRLNMLFSVLEH